MVGFGIGSMEVEVPGGGVVWVFDVKSVVVAGPVSTVEFSWAEGALEAASSSESSELKPLGGISAMMGRGGGRAVDSGADRVTRCFFFGCGASTGLDRCFDRTGTGIVVRVVAQGKSGTGLPHLGVSRTGVEGWPTLEVGLRALTSMWRCPSSSRGWRFGSGFRTIWVGMPP